MGLGWASSWPLLLVIPAMMLIGMTVMARTMRSGEPSHCGPRGGLRRVVDPAPDQPRETVGSDPLVLLRERYATGVIGHDEFERRLGALLRSDPETGSSRL